MTRTHCPTCHNYLDEPGGGCPHHGTTKTDNNPGTALSLDDKAGTRADDDVPIGTVIGTKYQIVGQISAGVICSVYEALHLDLNTRVALKLLHQEYCTNERQIDRFHAEAKCAIGLVHPHVVRVFDFGTHPQPHIAMEFIEGETLAKMLERNGALEWRRALDIMAQVCDGMASVHAVGLIHRDIKPSNIMIDRHSNMVKIIDFGVAKDILDLHKNTRTGETLGSPPYMSPEQCRGETLDARSDIYSFGCTMYELITNVRPFAGKTFIESMFKHLETDAPSLKKVRPDLRFPSGLSRVAERCLAVKPSARYQSATELKQDLARVASGHGREVATVKKRKRNLWLTLLSALSVFFLVATAIIIMILMQDQAGSNILATGDVPLECSTPVKIALNPPAELDGMTRSAIYKLREKMVAQHANILAAPYEPFHGVFGQIGDHLPWWGMKGYYWYSGQTGPTASDGASFNSPEIVNPFLLVSINFLTVTDWQKQAIGDPDKIANFPYVCLPDDLIWDPQHKRMDVTYHVSAWRLRLKDLNYPKDPKPTDSNDPFPQGELQYCNARDFGYSFMSYAIEDKSGSVTPAPGGIHRLTQFFHVGSTCGYSCNNLGETLNQWFTVEATPSSTARVFLWKKRPAKGAEPDVTCFIHFD